MNSRAEDSNFDQSFFQQMKEERQKKGRNQRRSAEVQFDRARNLASLNFMNLRKHSDTHYRLIGPGSIWAINVYPGNRRIYNPPGPKRGPYLKLPQNWTLLDVVKAAIEKSKRG